MNRLCEEVEERSIVSTIFSNSPQSTRLGDSLSSVLSKGALRSGWGLHAVTISFSDCIVCSSIFHSFGDAAEVRIFVRIRYQWKFKYCYKSNHSSFQYCNHTDSTSLTSLGSLRKGVPLSTAKSIMKKIKHETSNTTVRDPTRSTRTT